MPRQNRREFHRAARLRAEAAQALRAARRRARASQEAQVRATVARVLAGAPANPRMRATPLTPSKVLEVGVTSLLAQAPVSTDRRDRVLQLYRMAERALPEWCVLDRLPFFLLLAQEPWVRPLAELKVRGGSLRARREALIRHLLVRYSVPAFLYAAFDVAEVGVARVPEEDAWAVRVFARVGRGESMLDAAGRASLPVPLTRRMVHAFLGATARVDILVALRRAQAVGHGGSVQLGDALASSRLGTVRGPGHLLGEGFWDRVIAWFARTPGVPLREVPRWVEFIHERQAEAIATGGRFSLEGRTASSMARLVERWRPPDLGPGWAASGLTPMLTSDWSVVEHTTPAALRQEGNAMRHCVEQYVGLVREGRVSIWSLQRDGRSVGTLEVNLSTGRIQQAKGVCNRRLNPEESAVVRRWAAGNGLVVA